MSVFTLAISWLTISNLPWFMDPAFLVPVHYCFLQHWSLLLPPDTSTAESCFHFDPDASFFLELLVIAPCSYTVMYWTPSILGGSSFSFISFFLFILFMGFSQQEYWSVLPFPLPVDHNLSELFTMTHPSWVALHGMAHSFIELRGPFHCNKAVIHEGD